MKPANVGKLVPVWNLSLDNSTNASNQPLVIDGVMYSIAADNNVFALDAFVFQLDAGGAAVGRHQPATDDGGADDQRRAACKHGAEHSGGQGRAGKTVERGVIHGVWSPISW